VICRGFAGGTFGTSFWVKNVSCNLYNFVGFKWILSLVGVFKIKPSPWSAADLLAERLVRLFELKTWRGIYIILLDLSEFWVW
jgi:hypothetical protein